MYQNFPNKILLLVAHTDDETIGMGGTICRHINNGDEVYAFSMTDGVSSRQTCDKENVKTRLEASNKVSETLGFKWFKRENFPDNAMDSVPLIEIVKVIEEAKKKINPNIIYTHSSADLNIDHRIVNQATITAFRPLKDECWREIRTFEIPSSTDYGHKSVTNTFNPNLFIDISSYISKKLNALKNYEEEMLAPPNSRSYDGIQTLAKFRGNQSGLNYAEAFEVIRRIER